MKLRTLALACATLALPLATLANPTPTSNWTGVWESKLDGITAVTLTLADDAGALDGTIVFHVILKENASTPAHSGSTEPHTLIHPHVEGNKLSFQVRRGNGSNQILNMAVELNPSGKADFQCSNCGSGPKAELEKMH